MAKYLLDTTAIIDHLKGRKEVTSFLEQLGKQGDIVGCCGINITETYAGMKEHERGRPLNLFKVFSILKQRHK